MTVVLIALAVAHTFALGVPAYDPRKYRQAIAGRPAEVLVLGSPHLSQLPDKLDPALLEPLLNQLAAFKPEVITVEALSGEECETLLHFKEQHAGAWSDYCWPTDDMEKATGLTVPAATDAIDKTLANFPADASPAMRRRLAMLFFAANDRPSAMVQWLRLSEAERHAGDGLTQVMVDLLLRKGKPPNETYAIGSTLAARLGLERVYLADDHVSDSPSDPAYRDVLQRVWNSNSPRSYHSEFIKWQSKLKTSAGVIGYYRWLNTPENQRAAITSDMGRAALDHSPKLYGRQYLSWFENRNLRMAANIRGAFATRPDARVLVIVGATHKGYLDAYLDMMQDVRLIDAMQFLK